MKNTVYYILKIIKISIHVTETLFASLNTDIVNLLEYHSSSVLKLFSFAFLCKTVT